MADQQCITLRAKLVSPTVRATVHTPTVRTTIDTPAVPVVIVPGPPGRPGQDGAVIGGAAIDDTTTSTDRVWSSQHTADQIDTATTDLDPEVDLSLLFENALA